MYCILVSITCQTKLMETKERIKPPARFFEALFKMQNTMTATSSEMQATRFLRRIGMSD